MTTKEMKRLSRADLLEMLIEQGTEVERLRKQLAKTEESLKEKEALLEQRNLTIDRAGSIAEAALQLSGIFEAAEAASQQYMDNIRRLSERQEEVCRKREQESLETAEQTLNEMKIKCLKMETETKVRCEDMIDDAKRETQKLWEELASHMEIYLEGSEELQDLFRQYRMKQEWKENDETT